LHFVVMEGKYTDGYLKREGANAPEVQGDDPKIIGSPLDFVGLNVYQPAPNSPLRILRRHPRGGHGVGGAIGLR
jgi:hypothetical protein